MQAPKDHSPVGRALPAVEGLHGGLLERRAIPALRGQDLARPFSVSAGAQ
jgi:hypothetical protein